MYKTGLRQDAFKQGSIRRDNNYRTNTNWDEIMARLRKTASAGNIAIPDGSFRGLADTSTNPGTPTSDEWWSAQEVGIYTNFGNVEVTTITGVYNWLVWDNSTSTWSIQQVPVNYTSFIPTVTDGILDFNVDNNLRIGASPYSAKKGSDPGFSYLYIGNESPTFLNRLNLDGSLHLSQINVYSNSEQPSLSAEMNTNPAGWTCSAAFTNNGNGTYTKTATTGTLSTNITVTNGRRYLISWSGITSLVTITLGAVSITKTSQTTVYACDITAGASGSLSLSIFFNSTNTGVVSNISIKELTPITSRIASRFTHVTSAGDGLELRTNKTLNSIALGINALSYLYSGIYNTAFGSNSLSNLTVGNYNTAFGYASLSSLTSGEFNTAIGYNALRDCTIGNNLVVIGTYAGEKVTTAGRSVIIGSGAGRNVTTQGSNVLIGYTAGAQLNSGGNVCIGDSAYSAATRNGGTTAIGNAAGINATGASHTLVGNYAGAGLSTGTQNNAFGIMGLYGITTGSYNLGLGSYSGTLNAIPELYLNQSDAFGNDQDSIFIGYGASKQKLGSVLNNSIVIGNYARAYQNNQVVLGDVTNTSTYLRGKTEIYNHQVLGTDSCANGSFATTDYWTATGDIAFNTNKFTYTHSSGIGTLEQTSANRDAYGLAIKPNQWYKLSFNINHVSGTGTISGSINASLNGTVVTMTTILSSGERYLYFKTGASTGNLKLEFASTGTRVFDITYVRLQEITGGDLYVNNDIEQRRGTYQYFRQYFGTDTDNDWRTCAD